MRGDGMNLTSCENCGVVLDMDKLEFRNFWKDDGCVDFDTKEITYGQPPSELIHQR